MPIPRDYHISPLGRRRWFVGLRLIFSALLIGSGLVFLKSTAFNSILLGMNGFLSVILLVYLSSFRKVSDLSDKSESIIRAVLITLMAAELVVEGLLVNHVGGNFSPFVIFFIVTIVTASLTFRLIGSIVVASIAGLLYSLPILFDLSAIYEGLIEPTRLAGMGMSSDEAFYTVFLHLCLFYLCAFISGYLAENLFLASRELRKIRLETDEILEQMHSGLMTVDGNGKIVYFNRAAGEILGVSHHRARNKDVREFLHGGLTNFVEKIESVLANNRSELRVELTIKHPDKGILPIGLSLSVLGDEDSRPRGVIAVFQDLTEAKRIEDHLRASDRLAAIGRLAAGIAHEIRNPLASISGSVEILKDDLEVEGDDLRLLDLILKESSRLNTILCDFLNYARVTRMSSGRCNLAAVIPEVVALASTHSQIDKSIRILHSIHKDNITVSGSEDQVKQILWNLLLNAAQAVDPRRGMILISTEDCPNDLVSLMVADNGPGIPENIRERIFEPFFSTKGDGTGLGLPIVARIVDCLEGRIEVQSSPDWKTKVIVYLPVSSVETSSPKELKAVSVV
jgi:two-component system sensor histidine kinase PilS (NtrC family)